MNLVRSWPQGQAGPTPLGWRLPQPLMPPRVNGWPMGVVPSSDAEGLLESAVAWWDASRYRQGDRFLRNQGVAGELLDLRLGSSTVANTNDPTWLGVEDSGYAYLPGVGGNNLGIPYESALNSLDFEVWVYLDERTTGTEQVLYNIAATTQRVFEIAASNYLVFQAGGTVTSSTPVSASARGYGMTCDADTGAGQYEMKFYTYDGTSWAQLGVTRTGATPTTPTSTGRRVIGGYSETASLPANGKLRRVTVKSGIDGPTVLDVDCSQITSGSQTSFTALTGQTVTINRSTSGRKTVAQPGRGTGRANFLLGTDDYFEIPADRAWQHQLLNFGQADSFTVLAVARAWNASSSNVVLSKSDNVASMMIGYAVPESASTYRLSIGDGSRSFASSGPRTAGTLYAIAATRNVRDRTLASYLNGVAGTAAADSTRSIYSPLSFYVGRVGATYADMELLGAAVFRRALTAAEITSITRYYGA